MTSSNQSCFATIRNLQEFKSFYIMVRLKADDWLKRLISTRLYTSSEVKFLLGIKSDTTLIKKERNGEIKVATRIGNQKRYCPRHIKKLMGY